MLAVQPVPEGMKRRNDTFRASPGSAPSTKTGPVTGLMRPKSSPARSAAVAPGPSWPPDASRHSKWIVEPGSARSAGGTSRLQPEWWLARWIVCWQETHIGGVLSRREGRARDPPPARAQPLMKIDG